MREIEFKGYAKEELTGPQWITGYGVAKTDYTDGTSTIWLLTPYGDYEVYEESVGQYTGIKDSKGNKIYEGDILSRYDGTKRVVGFKNASFVYTNIPKLNQTHNTFSMFWAESEEWEVIGNVYENKENINLFQGGTENEIKRVGALY